MWPACRSALGQVTESYVEEDGNLDEISVTMHPEELLHAWSEIE